MYIFKKSIHKNKKYDVYDEKTKKFITAFGDSRYEQYEDKTPLKLYKHLNHYDNKRKELYYARHGKTSKKNSAKYFSHKYLW